MPTITAIEFMAINLGSIANGFFANLKESFRKDHKCSRSEGRIPSWSFPLCSSSHRPPHDEFARVMPSLSGHRNNGAKLSKVLLLHCSVALKHLTVDDECQAVRWMRRGRAKPFRQPRGIGP
jgi:hypothetical protein